MLHKLTIKAFFFNAKTDYLPYYKNFTIKINGSESVKRLLDAIKVENEDFSFPQKNLILKINNLIVEGQEKIENIVSKLGTTIQIDSANNYRSNNGLIINNNDFMQSYSLLEPYATEKDLEFYTNLYALHYASETSNFDRGYIGDAILILADKMIKDTPTNEKVIIKAIHSGLFDCEYENNLFNAQDYTKTINYLKELAIKEPNDAPSLCDMIKSKLGIKPKEEILPKTSLKTIENLKEKQIAFYGKNENISKEINKLETNEITFNRASKLSGESLLIHSRELALKKAGSTLLDAYDSGAEVIVVEDNNTFNMFEDNFKCIEKVVGRKMLNLELISLESFKKQVA